MSVESSPTPKKHRVIAWKPEEADESPPRKRRFPRWVVVTAAVLGGLFALRAAYVILTWEPPQPDTVAFSTPDNLVRANNLTQTFVDRSQAEFARGDAMRALGTIANATPDHPVIMGHLVTIDKLRNTADRALADRNYPGAVQHFEAVKGAAQQLAAMLEDRRMATEGYNTFLASITRLERFRDLNPDAYTQSITAAGASQTFLDQGSYTIAREKIDEATALLTGLEVAIKDELEANLAIGRAALTEGDGRAAKLAFTRALDLAEKNEFALNGLARAEKIEEVFAHQREATRLEAAGQLEEAQKHYEKAFELDKLSATAQAGVSRVKAAIRTRDFDQAMTQATEATEGGDWSAAITAYQAALKVQPENKEVQEKLAEARVREREDRIQDMLATAYEQERTYDWEGAKRTYLQLIAYEPGQKDAEEGLLRTGKVIRALLVFEKKIEEARSQAQRAHYQLSIAAFNEAMASKPSYLELTPEQDQLRMMLERQSRPVPVTFVSDKRTYVTISGVRMLNKFEQTTVPLLPGNYEVIGRRKGYEEVRERLFVRADEAVPAVTIIANKRL